MTLLQGDSAPSRWPGQPAGTPRGQRHRIIGDGSSRDQGVRHRCLSAWLGIFPALIGASVQARPDPQDLGDLLDKLQPAPTAENESQGTTPRLTVDTNGYLRYLAAPPSGFFRTAHAVAGDPGATAYSFLWEHARLVGLTSDAVDLTVTRRTAEQERTYVRFQQTYAGIPVFAAQIIVQGNSLGGVECVLSDIVTDVAALDEGSVSTAPRVNAGEAVQIAHGLGSEGTDGASLQITVPRLTIFAPSVLGAAGPIRLVWDMTVISPEAPYSSEQILLDAHRGKIVRRYPLAKDALEREIYDADNSTADPGTLVRAEGDGPAGIRDADDAYTFTEDAYAFYSDHHGRDSIDNAGMVIEATVRYCLPGRDCPWANAGWLSSVDRLYFGEGWVIDDILGHEYTHGVTDFESNLIYENHSGAINESLSDVWGEFIDLVNGTGSDWPGVRWDIGEELPGGALRDMADPPRFDDPDRMGHPDFVAPAILPGPGNDWGGVHTNSGVNNKLCYLLMDGDTFNQWSVYGMGMDRVADLYYEANARLLTSGSDYNDLYYVLEQAAANPGWLPGDRVNLHKACAAVEIADTEDNVYVDTDHFGIELGSDLFPFNTIAEAHDATESGDRMIVKSGSYGETLTLSKAVLLVSRSGTVRIGG